VPSTQSEQPARARRTPVALTIAGSDSGGGAGIQADLKAFARCGVHGASVITAVTAQNTTRVAAVHALPGEFVSAQARAVLEDIQVHAVKVGMLAGTEIIHAVARVLDELPAGTPVVVDPVMVAESGGRLLAADAEVALIAKILPRATVLTPNLPEARALAGTAAKADADAEELARAIVGMGPQIVVLTGGHRERAVDLFATAASQEVVAIAGERHPDGAAHGSGCTHSSVLAAQLALGHEPLHAAKIARAIAGQAIAWGLRDVGHGAGPVDAIGLHRMRSTCGEDPSRLP
jgi:hydroxymethylpyrimidine/phosphomethylpyrimidine kinase